MDSTLIEEIAKQLGMAVESAGQFLMDILPVYAVMKISGYAISIIAALIFIFAGYKLAIAAYDHWADEHYQARCRYEDVEETFNRRMLTAHIEIKAGTIAVSSIVLAAIIIPLLQWSVAPQAMFLKTLLDIIAGQ